MLNINQNFDLKAPVFNFDRDYFNSVEELNAYDTSNVPNHFVTNVAGMLYLFTDGRWLPMISTTLDDPENPEDHVHYVNLIDSNCYVSRSPDNNTYEFRAMGENTNLTMSSEPGIYLSTDIDDAAYPRINLTQETNEIYKYLLIGITDDGSFGLDIQNNTTGDIKILTNKELTAEEQDNGYSPVDISLNDTGFKAVINAQGGFMHKTDDNFSTTINGDTITLEDMEQYGMLMTCTGINMYPNNREYVWLTLGKEGGDYIKIGKDQNFKFSRPDDTEGGVISGIKSLTAFANPSATKVWATDGSTVNMPTKFSDLTNDNVYITGNKGETAPRFKITYNDDGVLRSQLLYGLKKASTCIPELGFTSYDTSGNYLSQIRIRPEDNRDDGLYLIQVQDVRGSKVNCVSSIVPNSFQVLNNETNTAAEFASNELIFYTHNNDFQVQLKINKEGITKTNGKATEIFTANGSTIDLTNYFNGTTTVDKLKSKAVEVIDDTNSVTVSPTGIIATNGSTTGSIKMLTNNELTEIEGYMCSPVDMSFTNNDGFSAHINSRAGFIHTTEDRMVSRLSGSGLTVDFPFMDNRKWNSHLDYCGLWFSFNDEDALRIWSGSGDEISIELGSDEETRFKISRPLDNSEGATITGVKSIKAFSDPSNTKVFATDGSTVDLTTKADASALATKANASDVLLKKSASGGYYIEANSNQLGEKAFAANDTCTASGGYSFAEGYTTSAKSYATHVEGLNTYAGGAYSHAEGLCTNASGYCSHALGVYNIYHIDAIHSVGIGNASINKNAEYIYAKNNENGTGLTNDPKNGYKYLIGVGGYDGISTDNTTYKSVQEVIADLTARIEQLEALVANCVSISNVDEQTN